MNTYEKEPLLGFTGDDDMGFGTHKWICSRIIFSLHGSYCHRPSGLDWLQRKIN